MSTPPVSNAAHAERERLHKMFVEPALANHIQQLRVDTLAPHTAPSKNISHYNAHTDHLGAASVSTFGTGSVDTSFAPESIANAIGNAAAVASTTVSAQVIPSASDAPEPRETVTSGGPSPHIDAICGSVTTTTTAGMPRNQLEMDAAAKAR